MAMAVGGKKDRASKVLRGHIAIRVSLGAWHGVIAIVNKSSLQFIFPILDIPFLFIRIYCIVFCFHLSKGLRFTRRSTLILPRSHNPRRSSILTERAKSAKPQGECSLAAVTMHTLYRMQILISAEHVCW